MMMKMKRLSLLTFSLVIAAQAQRDAVYSMETIITEFGPLFGVEITKEGTPEIYR